ncbi:MAG: zf-TFIIB domain-containing protein [Magnetococcales bacterium]|nr:zf-TFIIB domain-containing protein [Magnetococcales bacterium]
MPLLVCPNCEVAMLVVQRSGVELDTCPRCRGVWLDRGELDKLLQPLRHELEHHASSANTKAPSKTRETVSRGHETYHHHDSHSHDHSHHDRDRSHHDRSHHDKDRHYRKKNPLESILDIFD